MNGLAVKSAICNQNDSFSCEIKDANADRLQLGDINQHRVLIATANLGVGNASEALPPVPFQGTSTTIQYRVLIATTSGQVNIRIDIIIPDAVLMTKVGCNINSLAIPVSAFPGTCM